MTKSKTSKMKKGVTEHLEFGGVLGAAGMLVGLPVTVFYINLSCVKSSCSVLSLPSLPHPGDLLDWGAVMLVLCWLGFQVALSFLPIGQIAEGLPLHDGRRLKYRCNGIYSLAVSVLLFSLMWVRGVPVTFGYHHFIQIAATLTVFSYLLSIYLYVRSFSEKVSQQQLATGGNSGYGIYDFFIGRELNPRIGELDLKFFCELRPGLIGWVMLDLSFLAAAWERDGQIDPALTLVTMFHTFYVADALWFEEAILTTMDIVHDGFGFMLVFGDLVWVPFLYSLQARFLLEHPQRWHVVLLCVIVCVKILGYTIFRGANSQKNDFRQNPNNPDLKHLKTLETSGGKKLLISGWWGMCRHPNYLGDLLMATSWSLPSGFTHIWPWFYPIYFSILLVHRAQRDDVHCREKYSKDWVRYCQLVPTVILPSLPGTRSGKAYN